MKAPKILTISLILFLSSCASLNSVSLTPIPAQRTRQVRTEVSKWIFLGFSFDNDFINPIVNNLKQQCPNGVISGVFTKDETVSYLLVFKKNVVVTGYCGTSVAKNSAVEPRRPSNEVEPLSPEVE